MKVTRLDEKIKLIDRIYKDVLRRNPRDEITKYHHFGNRIRAREGKNTLRFSPLMDNLKPHGANVCPTANHGPGFVGNVQPIQCVIS